MASSELRKNKDSSYWKGSMLAAVFAALILLSMPWWQVDDAFISYRYGKNWLETGELDWNPGDQEHVEGYTGILLPALAAASIYLGLPLPFAIQVLGLAMLMMTIPSLSNWMQRKSIRPMLHHIALAVVFVPPLLYQHSVSGLETIFFAAFLVAFLAEPTKDKARMGILAPLLILLVLCRPEGVLVLAGTLLAAFSKIKAHPPTFRKLIGSAVPAILVFLVHLWWRKGYYGEWLPNTYFAKRYDGLLNPDSIKQFLQFFSYYLALPFLLSGSLLLYSGKIKMKLQSWSPDVLIFLVLGSGLLLAYARSHLYMNYGHRFFLPLLMPTVVLLAAWAENALARLSQVKKAVRHGFFAMLSLAFICQSMLWIWQYKQEWYFQKYYQSIMQDELIPAGKHLGKHFQKGELLAVYMDAGAIGYYSGLDIIDFGRLNDKYLAQSQPSIEEVKHYFFSLQPRLAIFTSESQDSYSYIPEAEAILSDPRFRTYRFAKEWSNGANFPYFQRLYIRQND